MESELKKIEEELSAKYFLVKKKSFHYFAGGFFAVVVAILGVGYKSVYEVLDSEFTRKVKEDIQKVQNEITQKDLEIESLLTTLQKTNQQMIQFKEDIESNVNISNEPLKIPKPVTFTNGVYYTMSYWSDGANHAGPHFCSQPTVPNGFEFVFKGSLSGKERPECKIPPKHCESSGEFCKNFRVTTACLINKVWHRWYKEYVSKNGLSYSIENVCRQPG